MGHIKLAHPLLVIYSFNDLRISTQVYELRFTGFFVKLVRHQVKTCWCVGLVEFPVQWVDADGIPQVAQCRGGKKCCGPTA